MDGDGGGVGDDRYNVGGRWNESAGGDSSSGDGGLLGTPTAAVAAAAAAPSHNSDNTGIGASSISTTTFTTYPAARTMGGGTTSEDSLFPRRLHLMLHDADGHIQGGGGGGCNTGGGGFGGFAFGGGGGGFSDVVSWGQDSPHNFKVHNKRRFEKQVLPKYFKMTKYKSFTRQLHNYDFQWIRQGNDKGGCTFFCLCGCVRVVVSGCSLTYLLAGVVDWPSEMLVMQRDASICSIHACCVYVDFRSHTQRPTYSLSLSLSYYSFQNSSDMHPAFDRNDPNSGANVTRRAAAAAEPSSAREEDAAAPPPMGGSATALNAGGRSWDLSSTFGDEEEKSFGTPSSNPRRGKRRGQKKGPPSISTASLQQQHPSSKRSRSNDVLNQFGPLSQQQQHQQFDLLSETISEAVQYASSGQYELSSIETQQQQQPQPQPRPQPQQQQQLWPQLGSFFVPQDSRRAGSSLMPPVQLQPMPSTLDERLVSTNSSQQYQQQVQNQSMMAAALVLQQQQQQPQYHPHSYQGGQMPYQSTPTNFARLQQQLLRQQQQQQSRGMVHLSQNSSRQEDNGYDFQGQNVTSDIFEPRTIEQMMFDTNSSATTAGPAGVATAAHFPTTAQRSQNVNSSQLQSYGTRMTSKEQQQQRQQKQQGTSDELKDEQSFPTVASEPWKKQFPTSSTMQKNKQKKSE